MKTTIEQKPSLSAVKLHAAHCRGKSSLPILSTCLVSAVGDSTEYVSTDLDSWLKSARTDRVSSTGAACVPAKRFAECLASCKNSVDLELVSAGKTIVDKKEVENFNLAVRNGSTFSVPAMPAAEFPPMPAVAIGQASFSIGADQLNHDLARVAFAMSSESTRYVLNGVYFEISPITKAKTDVGLLNLVATDGRRLALQEVDGITVKADFGAKNQPIGFIVPSAAVEMILKLTARETSPVYITFGVAKKGESAVYVQFDFSRKDGTQLRYITRLVDGNFPAYRQVIPLDSKFSAI
jgi:DNA polymerase-3 subunit beta